MSGVSCEYCGNEYKNKDSRHSHWQRYPNHRPDTTQCPTCRKPFISLGQHWGKSRECQMEMSDKQIEILTGIMMGDGTLNRRNNTPTVEVKCINNEYLDYLDNIFGIFSNGVSFYMSGRESCKQAVDSGLAEDAEISNYSDVYRWMTINHTNLYMFDWYTGEKGEKVWPEDIDLTPTVLKHWYVGDGNYRGGGSRCTIRISAANERGNEEKISSYFKRAGLPKPSRFDHSRGLTIVFNKEESKQLFEYMGESVPGFERKWPSKSGDDDE